MDHLIFPEIDEETFDYTTDQWVNIATYAIDRLEEFLGIPIDHEVIAKSGLKDGFCIEIFSPTSLLGQLHLSWQGTIGTSIQTQENGKKNLLIVAFLFLYCNTKKMKTNDGKDYLYYQFVDLGDSNYGWRAFSQDAWLEDEYGEFGYYENPDNRFLK